MSTPCSGLHALFDSTDPHDHTEAAKLCATCPVIQACRTNLADVLADAKTVGIEGTWAGQLYGTEGKRRANGQKLAALDLLYDAAAARKAHAQYKAGARDEWTVNGHRLYDLRRKPNRQRSAS